MLMRKAAALLHPIFVFFTRRCCLSMLSMSVPALALTH
jgi:hypothetical protein